MTLRIRSRAAILGCTVATALTTPAFAGLTISGSGSGWGSAGIKSASALFEVSGTNLVITLTNTSPSDVLVPSDVLTAIFFDVSGPSLSLTRVSGVLGAGSSVAYDPDGQPAGGVIGGEWAYLNGITTGPTSASYGVSSTGLDIFGPGDRFPGPDLAPPPSPDGVQYGLLSAGDNLATGNGGITGSGGLIKNSAVFTLSGLPANFDLSRINNAFFLYGTAIGEGGMSPTPGTAVLFGMAGLAATRRRRA